VFEIVNTSTGYASAPTILANFNGTDGAYPNGGLIIDKAGDLYGTTEGGGTAREGTVFEIKSTGSSYATTPTVLVSFNDTNGYEPRGTDRQRRRRPVRHDKWRWVDR